MAEPARPRSSIDRLSSELLHNIGQFLDLPSQLEGRKVSRQWQAAIDLPATYNIILEGMVASHNLPVGSRAYSLSQIKLGLNPAIPSFFKVEKLFRSVLAEQSARFAWLSRSSNIINASIRLYTYKIALFTARDRLTLLHRVLAAYNYKRCTQNPQRFPEEIRSLDFQQRIQFFFSHPTFLREWLLAHPHLLKIRSLSLSSTRLRMIPDELELLTLLETLNLSKNQLLYLQEGIFSKLRCLQQLDLSENQLSSLSVENLRGLVALSYLNLSRNRLLCIEKTALSSLYLLHNLYLSYNRLSKLPQKSADIKRFSFYPQIPPSFLHSEE